LKASAGPVAMAELDVFADHDAAVAYAALYAEGGTRAEFLKSFQEALFLSSAYFFKVFRPTPDRPDKLARAIGVLLMAARLSGRELKDPIAENEALPLDAALYATLSVGQNQLAVYKAEPSREFLAVAKDGGGGGFAGVHLSAEAGGGRVYREDGRGGGEGGFAAGGAGGGTVW
jgi:hypothetical protein